MRFLALIFLLIGLATKAQNLVPNPGFELFYDCPTQIGQFHLTQEWFSVNGGTPEYFHASCRSDWNKAHTGSGYIGFINFGHYNKVVEYIGVKLIQPLEADTYLVRYSIRAEHEPYFCDRVDVFFSDEDLSRRSWTPIYKSAQIINEAKFTEQPNDWIELEATYVANGQEKYLYIGNFTQPPLVDLYANPAYKDQIRPGWYTYVLVDDVSVAKHQIAPFPEF